MNKWKKRFSDDGEYITFARWFTVVVKPELIAGQEWWSFEIGGKAYAGPPFQTKEQAKEAALISARNALEIAFLDLGSVE